MRKISAHYYLDNNGVLRRYPIITFADGVILAIECYDTLPEIAGLEFYSGVILPRFVDIVLLDSMGKINSPSILSPLVAQIAAMSSTKSNYYKDISSTGKISSFFFEDTNLEVAGIDCGISVVAKINKLVESGFFTDALEGLTYFTRDLSQRYFKSPREVAVGCKAEFLLCSDMLFIQTNIVNELKISILK